MKMPVNAIEIYVITTVTMKIIHSSNLMLCTLVEM
jgi:hypothetical protein